MTSLSPIYGIHTTRCSAGGSNALFHFDAKLPNMNICIPLAVKVININNKLNIIYTSRYK